MSPTRSHGLVARAFSTLTALSLALTAVTAVVATTPAHAEPTRLIGTYRGSAQPTRIQAFGDWLGRPMNLAEDFIPKDQGWAGIEQSPNSWWIDGWVGKGYRMVWGVPMLPDGAGSITEGATGVYNSHYQILAKNLVARGQGNSILRLGWEFNGGWYPWAAKVDPAGWAAYWRQIVNTMRAVPGNSFTFDWNPNNGYNQFPAEQAYPGDAYVDYVGVDTYDQSWVTNHQDPAVRWNDIYEGNLSGGRGLRFWRDFARAHGKPLSLPEWALVIRGDTPEHGGGDNPDFIAKMHNFINTENVAYHIYFEFDAPDGKHELSRRDTIFPQSAAKFRDLFRSATAPVTTTTTAPPTTTTTAPPTTTTTAPPTTTTTVPAITSLSSNAGVSDDFSRSRLSSTWAFVNPSRDVTLSMTGFGAKLSIPAGNIHDLWGNISNAPRLLQNVANTDFDVETKFETTPSGDIQLEGIYVEASPGNWIRAIVYSYGGKLWVQASTSVNGISTARVAPQIPTYTGPVWLRLKRVGNAFAAWWSKDGTRWSQFDSFNHTLAVSKIGVYAGTSNAGSGRTPAFTAIVDYFFSTASPIVPEDGGRKPAAAH